MGCSAGMASQGLPEDIYLAWPEKTAMASNNAVAVEDNVEFPLETPSLPPLDLKLDSIPRWALKMLDKA